MTSVAGCGALLGGAAGRDIDFVRVLGIGGVAGGRLGVCAGCCGALAA